MMKFDAQILSEEIIRPSSPEIHQKEPFKLCVFDQLTPTTYVPVIVFYARTDNNTTNILTQLKKSLSEALNILYPSGRIFSNMFLHDFDAGVPFSSVRIGCRLSEFLRHHQIETLNNLLPCPPFCKESNHQGPLLVCQVTMFACGGIALGICASHKITDAKTGFILGFVWSTICQGYHPEIRFPALSKASLIFPPKNPMPKNYIIMMENLWFTEGNFITRTFVFNEEAIAVLKDMAKGEVETTPTRTEAVSGFIWKCSMAASRAIQGTSKPSIVVQAVNMRPKGKLTTLDGSVGNVFWWASALSNAAETGTELSTLVELMSQSIAVFDDEYMRSVQGEQGFEAIAEHLNQLELLFSFEKPDIFAFTNWINTDFHKLDFEWGQPSSFALLAK
ncbi:stemmadenine O-acetyltransferase-like [Gossypium arboreum]|uniref:stemmadenine O-acetyltransferase-like n=1 Tax=Gossypium arboreum TaxID=29729 RepID=UPI000818FCAB|nr:stemmadenine O-acetyltransferase-like [Gossypium arboreum]